MSARVGYGIIGTGARAGSIYGHISKRKDEVFLRAVCEPNVARRAEFLERCSEGAPVCYDDYGDLVNDEEVQWVIVTSPNRFHKEHIIAAFESGKHVFAEKPLATSIEDCVAIMKTHAGKPELLFATGFVLRYSPLYRKMKELLEGGAVGEIVAVQADENITAAHGGHIMTCWRRFSEFSGSHMLEKCCHDMDLLNWLIGSVPSKVASFGGRNIFIPEHADNMSKFTDVDGESSIYMGWHDPTTHDADNPFTSEKDLVDNQVAIMEYRDGVRATFQTVMSCAIPERRMYFTGTEGTMIGELYTGMLQVRRLGEGEATEQHEFVGSMHGGGDEIICDQLVDSMVKGTSPGCSGEEGLRSAVVSLAIEQARLTGEIVNLEPIWGELGITE
jgi:predicted dehydrogenase